MRKLLLLAALGLAACGSSSSSSTTGSGSTSGSGSGGTSGGQSVTFTISSGKNWQASVAVPANGTVHVVNNDASPHTFTSTAATGTFTPGAPAGVTAFDSGTINAGATADVVIKGPVGTAIPVYCKFHNGMMSPANPHGHRAVASPGRRA